MKKLFALLLALAMLLPMGLITVPNAEGEFTTQPFYALGWSDFDETIYPYLDGLVTSSFRNIGDRAILSYGGASIMYGSYTQEDVNAYAAALKKTMDARPEGMRYWHIAQFTKILKLAPRNVINIDHGLIQIREITEAILKRYSEIGGQLDGVVIDTEYIGMSSWYVYANTDKQTNNYQKNKNVYAEIVSDPHYINDIRPMLVDRGFPFWENPSGEKSEIFSICNVNKGEKYDLARSIWDTVIRVYLNQCANYWCYTPLKTYYPAASLSDYQSHDSLPWLKLAGITDDGVALTGGRGHRVGTASSFSYYYARPGTSFYEDKKQYVGYNDAYYEASAFNSLMYDINFTRHMYEGTETKQIAPWITSYIYGGQKPASMAYTPYYTELLYHLGMFDPEPFLSYTYVNEYKDDDGTISMTTPKYVLTQTIMNEIMAELTKVAGFSDRKPIELPQNWNTEYVVTGMYTGGRNLWRITPNTDEISREDFLVDSATPTFSVKGSTITFPGGKILTETAISTAGSVGYWVETDANVTPIVTNDPDRYEKYPSYLENFDSYAVGNMYGSYANPSYAWNYTLTNGTAQIVESGTGKALAVTGTVTVQNKELPYRITAGDSYAEDQAWEITITVPEGLSADAEITLMYFAADSKVATDKGFVIKGGKLYYTEGTELKEMMDISAGTYTLRREMDFNVKNAFTCDYIVLDAAGQELKSAKDVAINSFTLIDNITFLFKNVDKTVQLDNYKLFLTGLTTDFELYDAKTGMNVKGDATKEIRSRETAYRLSWLNGTDEVSHATVMADVYENGALKEKRVIKNVEMKPGYDGIVTGVVALAEGESAIVYLHGGKVEAPPADPTEPSTEPTTQPTEPGTEGTDGATETTAATTAGTGNTTAKKNDNTMIIVLVVIVVVCGGALGATMFLTKKK